TNANINEDNSEFKDAAIDAAINASLTAAEIAASYVPFINMVKILTLTEVDCGVKDIRNQLDTIVQGMNILRTRQPDNIHSPKVEPSHLNDHVCRMKQDFRGSEDYPVIRKFYKNCVDVACKPIKDV
ncbi:4929_t:CDS:2, partial [Racocetra persica]